MNTAINTLNNALKIPSAKKVTAVKQPQTAEVKESKKKKPVIPALQDGEVYASSGGEVYKLDVAHVAVVQPAEIQTSHKTLGSFALNLLAGHVHADILDAYKADKKHPTKSNKANSLTTLLGGKDARHTCYYLRQILAVKADKLQKIWNNHVLKNKQRETEPSLSGIAKAIEDSTKKIAAKEVKEERQSFREEFSKALKGRKEEEIMALPAWVYDLLVEFKLVGEEDTPEAKPKKK